MSLCDAEGGEGDDGGARGQAADPDSGPPPTQGGAPSGEQEQENVGLGSDVTDGSRNSDWVDQWAGDDFAEQDDSELLGDDWSDTDSGTDDGGWFEVLRDIVSGDSE